MTNIPHALVRKPKLVRGSSTKESAHHAAQNGSALPRRRGVRAAAGRHGGARGRSPFSFWARAVGKRTAVPVRSRIPSCHPCAGYGLVFLPCGGLQSRQDGGVHRGLLCAKEPSLPLRGAVRPLRQTGGKQPLSLRMTKARNTPPSGRRFYPSRHNASEQYVLRDHAVVVRQFRLHALCPFPDPHPISRAIDTPHRPVMLEYI
jgi:hypothetical protein